MNLSERSSGFDNSAFKPSAMLASPARGGRGPEERSAGRVGSALCEAGIAKGFATAASDESIDAMASKIAWGDSAKPPLPCEPETPGVPAAVSVGGADGLPDFPRPLPEAGEREARGLAEGDLGGDGM